jgi:hypothetical protein
MTTLTLSRPRLVLVTAVTVLALLLAGAQAARSAPSLPSVSAEELLASVVQSASDQPPMSGELALTLGLGLPVLPDEGMDGEGLADLLGESRLRVERSGDGVRAAVLGRASERLLVTDGSTITTWNSRTLEATVTTLPDHEHEHHHDQHRDHGAGPRDGRAAIDPQALSERLVLKACEHADLTVDGTARVAGRDAYRLTLVPTDPGTTLGRVEVDIDDTTRVPLRTALFARGAEAPSIELAWTRVSFDPIDPATFTFTPPPGATVTHRDLRAARPDGADLGDLPGPLVLLQQLAPIPGAPGPLVGEGFATVAVLPLPADVLGDAGAFLPLDGPLLAVRVVEAEGRRLLLTGLVPLARLDDVAAEVQAAASPR